MYGILAAGKAIVAAAPNERTPWRSAKDREFSVAADPDRRHDLATVVRRLAADPARVAEMGEQRFRGDRYDRVKELRNLCANRQSLPLALTENRTETVNPAETFWTGKRVLVTGGASFIGSTLTDQLLARGAKVRIVDDLTSGHLDNCANHSQREQSISFRPISGSPA